MQPLELRRAFGLGVVVFSLLVSAAPARATSCNIDFRLASHVTLGALQFRAGYGLRNGEFLGEGKDVLCTNTSAAQLATFEDNDATKQLQAGFVTVDGLTGPAPLARCRFAGPQRPTVADFVVTVIDASDIDLNPITANVTVAAISCSTCGDANGDGRITAADALIALKAAVGSGSCALAECDASGDGTITASDALLVLKAAVGAQVELRCGNGGTTTTTTSTTTTTLGLCPTNGPLTDLRNDCSAYGYFYQLDGLVEGLSTDGTTVVVAQTDGIDTLGYYGPVTGARTFRLTHVSLNGSPFYPVLDKGSVGGLSADGRTLDLTIKLEGKTYAFNGATWIDTQPLMSAGGIDAAVSRRAAVVASQSVIGPHGAAVFGSFVETLRR